MDSYQQAIAALPDFLAGPLAQIGPEMTCHIHEVRLRAGCPIWLNLGGSLCPVQRLSDCPPNLKALRPTQAQMEDVLYTLCGGSVHTHQNELANGYLTLPGGHRVGVGGQYLFHPEEGVVLQAVHSLNIRIAREKQMVLPPQLTQLLQEHFIGLLVSGEPDSGKTTLLRSIAVFLAELGKAVSIIDERQELWPPSSSYTRPPVDFIAGLPKEQAVQMALRTLAPQVILLDELGGMEEVQSLEQGFFSGVNYIASLHAASLEEALCRPQVAYMKSQKMLRVIVQLTGRQAPGQISGVHVL